MKAFVYLGVSALLLLTIAACAGIDQKQPSSEDIRRKISEAYGVESFGKISTIQYQFNLEKDGEEIIRKWMWRPKTDVVVYQGTTSQLYGTEYNRKQLAENPLPRYSKIDAWFVNDQYWLLFPFHLVWDDQVKVEVTGRHFLPMGWGRALRVLVTYPKEGGYTPGDTYELFLDENYRLIQWVYRRGGADDSARVSTWEDHRRVGPVTIAMEHKGKDGKFRVWFTHVAVQLEGSDELIRAQ